MGGIFNAKILKEIFYYYSKFELNIIRFKFPELPEFSLGVPLRITDVNQEQ